MTNSKLKSPDLKKTKIHAMIIPWGQFDKFLTLFVKFVVTEFVVLPLFHWFHCLIDILCVVFVLICTLPMVLHWCCGIWVWSCLTTKTFKDFTIKAYGWHFKLFELTTILGSIFALWCWHKAISFTRLCVFQLPNILKLIHQFIYNV